MELKYPDSLKGQFLMAMPGLADPNFFQTVTFMCEHTQAGAVGIVINRLNSSLTGKERQDIAAYIRSWQRVRLRKD